MPKGFHKDGKRNTPPSRKGIKHSEETKRKIGLSNSISQKGKKMSVEARKNMSESHKGKKAFWFGKHLTTEAKRKLSLSLKGKPKPKVSLALKGRKLSPEHIANIRKSLLGKTGELARGWQGGKSFEKYSLAWTPELKQAIRQKDNFICKLCGKYPAFDVHHIDYNKKNCEPSNLITLCRNCNVKVNSNREYWTNYFNLLCTQK